MLETFYTRAPLQILERAVTTVLAGGVFFPSLRARFFAATFHACVYLVRSSRRCAGAASSSAPRASSRRRR